MRPCVSCPTRLISITSRNGPNSTVLRETSSSAGWAAARDAVSPVVTAPLLPVIRRRLLVAILAQREPRGVTESQM